MMFAFFTAMPSSGQAQAPNESVFALGKPFVDNAIFQQHMEVPVWGTAKPGTKVRVTLAGHTGAAVASSNGTWRL